jgi:hypothetical protein
MVSEDQAKYLDFKPISLTGVINFLQAVFFWTPHKAVYTDLDSEGN